MQGKEGHILKEATYEQISQYFVLGICNYVTVSIKNQHQTHQPNAVAAGPL
jgi:hypothetical protein